MAMVVTETCINCGNCEPACPNEAISAENIYRIAVDRCTECVGAFEKPPVRGGLPDPGLRRGRSAARRGSRSAARALHHAASELTSPAIGFTLWPSRGPS